VPSDRNKISLSGVVSQAVRREPGGLALSKARWDQGKKRCGDLLARASGTVSADVLDALDRAQAADLPPSDPWNR